MVRSIASNVIQKNRIMYSLIVAAEKEKIVKESINGKNETRYKSIMYEAILRLYVGLLRL
ncbi:MULTISPECIES: hypothetical protein [Bacillus cereus group]|nr:hypothetical protein [Bacillus toyonensis]MCA1045809.1 transcriptional regulator [Bacillus toyonensis]MED3197782.1 transcriptional regulator [Bacillus toyonensis]MED3539129.1 transcriptional regulator [Bacillus toyonensis]MEE2021915.1 transcriptional regulator [Bacillus toyonensis]WIG34857.1 transcriptional regulator [Bacillus toyonensis]